MSLLSLSDSSPEAGQPLAKEQFAEGPPVPRPELPLPVYPQEAGIKQRPRSRKHTLRVKVPTWTCPSCPAQGQVGIPSFPWLPCVAPALSEPLRWLIRQGPKALTHPPFNVYTVRGGKGHTGLIPYPKKRTGGRKTTTPHQGCPRAPCSLQQVLEQPRALARPTAIHAPHTDQPDTLPSIPKQARSRLFPSETPLPHSFSSLGRAHALV